MKEFIYYFSRSKAMFYQTQCSKPPKLMKSLLASMSILIAFQTNVLAKDIIYYSDVDTQSVGKVKLFAVDLNLDQDRAELTLLSKVPIESAHLAVTPDGSKVYLVGTDLAYYDVVGQEYHRIGKITGNVELAVQAAFSPAGTLYIGSGVTDKIYTLDLQTAQATSLGTISLPNGKTLDIQGADFAFVSNEVFYLLTSSEKMKGLYKVTLGSPLRGERVESFNPSSSERFSGLAVLEDGSLIYSKHEANKMFIIARTGEQLHKPKLYRDGELFLTAEGDMASVFNVTTPPPPLPEEPPPAISYNCCSYIKADGSRFCNAGLYDFEECKGLAQQDGARTFKWGQVDETAAQQCWVDHDCQDTPVHNSLKITLTEFTATAVEGAIALQWTAIPEDTVAFRLWRGVPKGETCSQQVADYFDVTLIKESDDSDKPLLIWTIGDSRIETTYSYLDQHVVSGVTYCYVIEDLGAYSGSTYYLDFIPSATAR
jgi:hypothetical protein